MGFDFDPDLEGFEKGNQEEREYNALDFILCLDEGLEEKGDANYIKAFFITKGLSGEYDLFLDPPYMKYFLREVNAVANPVVSA